ncbi:sigma-70 family RNA polymerase sigma factor [Candidatus Uhrbacteria bacterium]|nr:sigma-70 family RNA polymerase sigma factor [Candidatus Uhrbacteria bacterium]
MNKKQFPDFYKNHVKQVYKFLLFRLKGNRAMAEDLTQDIFLKALNAFETYDPEKSEHAWILAIARNHLINTLQKEKEHLPLEEIEATLRDQKTLVENIALQFEERQLIQAIQKLPPEDAMVIRMKYLEGWDYEEIALETKKTAGSLRIQAHRALKALAKLLKQKM